MAPHKFAFGLNKGYKTTKRDQKSRVSTRRGKLSASTKMVRALVREVCGLAPYEKRMIDIYKTGLGNPDKRNYKIAKKRLGTHKRALIKRDEMKSLYSAMEARRRA